jgi:hypothetical protein
MKALAILCAIAIAAIALPPASACAHVSVNCRHDADNMFRGNDVSIGIEDGSIVFTSENDETVEITKGYDLIVNGDAVQLRGDQRRLVKEYYDSFQYIMDEAKEIGKEGIKIGARGAALGIATAADALKILLEEWDRDEAKCKLERKVNRKAEKLEAAADRLEKRANRLERKANALEKLHGKLRREISELDNLGWF